MIRWELRSILTWLGVILLVLWVINNPSHAAGLVHNAGKLLSHAARSLSYIADHA